MRSTVLISVLIAAASAASADERDCNDPMADQNTLNICAYEAYQRADEDLNAAYKLAMSVARSWDETLSEDLRGAADALREAQRAWIPFRDAACEAEGFLFRGGSMEPLIVNSCLETLTRERTESLRAVYEMN